MDRMFVFFLRPICGPDEWQIRRGRVVGAWPPPVGLIIFSRKLPIVYSVHLHVHLQDDDADTLSSALLFKLAGSATGPLCA